MVSNSIFWMNGHDFFALFGAMPAITVDQVSDSATAAPGFAGHNGTIAANPRFVNPARGDYRLQPGSPARGMGYSPG